ncbi:MAG: hypothetical protein ACR2LQ_09030 [Acidimicrobiales bacterium]
MTVRHRSYVVVLALMAVAVASIGVAAAGISSGNYSFQRQRCSGFADDADQSGTFEPGCRSATISVADGAGNEGVGLGTQQTADGQGVKELTAPVLAPEALDPASGLSIYFGADDNLDSGEHDSSSVIHDGPSDGGAGVVAIDPASINAWLSALAAGDTPYLLTHPVPIGAGIGSCADGICESLQTQRQLASKGGSSAPATDVANYDGHAWDPETCGGPSDTEADCGPGGIAAWHDQYPSRYVEPGVQIYEDPDPQGSPIGPYPLPAIAVTSCGIFIGGGPVQLPASPLTNSAGQLAIKTGC